MNARKLSMLIAGAMLFALVGVAPALAEPRSDADWTQHYFPSGDGVTMLHADVLRPKGLSPKRRTPVILTVSPYTNHAGATTEYDPSAEGPSNRFYDFLDLTHILQRRYTYVMVDLPGFGASGGCNDWGGVREQEAVKAAVEWAASQPWSTGRVGLMGKSYDGWTGLMGIAQKPKGLAAVVAMEPVYSGYRYLYNNGIRFLNSLVTPAGFQAYDAKPGPLNDDVLYNANGAPQAWCYGVNLGLQQQDDPESAFWAERDLLRTTKGSRTPLFLTQGFLETNTKPDGAFALFKGMRGPKRAWFGQFDHVRGWERDRDGKGFSTGRSTFVAEMMRFFDRHVKGLPAVKARAHSDPRVVVQDSSGRYRAESSWPPADAHLLFNKLRTGSYEDDGSNSGAGSNGGHGLWTFSQRLPYNVWMAGEPIIDVEIDAVPRANLVANVYDVAPDGKAVHVSRGAFLARGATTQHIRFETYGQDWLLRKGHRIGVLLSGANSDWWVHIPTSTSVTVLKAQIGLPLLRHNRTRFIAGRATSRLKEHLESETLRVQSGQIQENDSKFKLPGRLR